MAASFGELLTTMCRGSLRSLEDSVNGPLTVLGPEEADGAGAEEADQSTEDTDRTGAGEADPMGAEEAN